MAMGETTQLALARDAMSMLKFFELRDIEASHHVGADCVCILSGTRGIAYPFRLEPPVRFMGYALQ